VEDRGVLTDTAEAAYRAAYSVYLSHVMACRKCYAPHGRYCSAGSPLRLEADARFILLLPDPSDRRRLLKRDFLADATYGQLLKKRVITLFNGAEGEDLIGAVSVQ